VNKCGQEMCPYWTGDGCVSGVMPCAPAEPGFTCAQLIRLTLGMWRDVICEDDEPGYGDDDA